MLSFEGFNLVFILHPSLARAKQPGFCSGGHRYLQLRQLHHSYDFNRLSYYGGIGFVW